MAFVKLDKNTSASRVNTLLKNYLNRNAKAAFYGKLVKLEIAIHKRSAFHKRIQQSG
jgi:hypothetical protein